METADIVADISRFLQYLGAVGLFGTALFVLIHLLPSGAASDEGPSWPWSVWLWASGFLIIGTLLSLLAQSASMNAIPITRLDAASIWPVLTDTLWGEALAARFATAVAALTVAVFWRSGRSGAKLVGLLGVISLASFVFTGHGASDDGVAGLVHLFSDMAHSIAAGVWLGALAGFLALVFQQKVVADPYRTTLARALSNFSGTGTLMVAVLVVTGLINSYFLVGLAGLSKLSASPYLILLMVKLVVFALMLGLAALNRFRLTPALEAARGNEVTNAAINALRRSLSIEAAAGTVVLLLVSVFGMMQPPASL